MTITTETQIANLALTLCGHSTITSMAQNTTGAVLCNLHYALARDATLRAHPWNFAIRRAELASEVVTIPFEYDYSFPLPTDPFCLKVIRTSEDALGYSNNPNAVYGFPGLVGGGVGNTYRVEGRSILTNSDTLKIEYIARVTDVTQFDPLFVEALTYKLAAAVSMKLTDNASMMNNAAQMFQAKINEARGIDAQEGTPRAVVDSSGWITARV